MQQRDDISRRTPGPCRVVRRGSAYFLVLLAVTLVTALGLSGIMLARVEMRTARTSADWQGATMLAYSAVDHALLALAEIPNWRDTLQNEAPIPAIALGDGEISWMLEDAMDSDLDDNTSDPLRIHGIGQIGDATRALSVLVFPSGAALDVLRTTAHAAGDVRVLDGALLRRGPLSAGQELRVETDMFLSGSVEAASLDNGGTISGTITVPAPAQTMPAAALYEIYKDMSTKIDFPHSSRLENGVLGAAINTFDDELNAAGIYRIDVNGSSTNPKKLTIRSCRIAGTLLVTLKARSTLEITDGVVWEPASASYPALIVYAENDDSSNVIIGGRGVLSEIGTGVNFNPPELPFNGGPGDLDLLDTYDSVLRGVYHIIRKADEPLSDTTIDGSDRIVGCVIADGDLHLENAPSLEADVRLLATPPLGYTTGNEMIPIAGTWRWETAS